MERRLLLWFVTSTAFLLIYMALNAMFVPPPPRPAAKTDATSNEAAEKAKLLELADQAPADGERPPAAEETEQSVVAPARVTLGSMDPKSGFFVLATLNNRGGTIERLELTERTEQGKFKYRRVDIDSGYLGYLAAEPSPKSDGCFVRVVGPGSPAALAVAENASVPAGLRVDDLIVAVNGKAIAGPKDLDRILSATRPGDTVSLEVQRTDPSVEGDAKPASLKFNATLTEHPLDLIRLASTGGEDEIEGNLSRLSCRLTLSQLGEKSIATGDLSIAGLEWLSEAYYQHEAAGNNEQVSFNLPLSSAQLLNAVDGPIALSRTYQVKPGSYLIDMTVGIKNNGEQPQRLAYRLEGPAGVTLEGWWYSTKISPNYFGGASARDVIYKSEQEGHVLISGFDLLKRANNSPKEPFEPIFVPEDSEAARSLRYIGVDAQYFDVAYVPAADTASLNGFRRAAAMSVTDPEDVVSHKERAADASFFVDSLIADLPPGATLRQPLQLFAGPKIPELLATHGLDDAIEYGWFGRVSKILGWILHKLYGGIGNYAIAIILLTVIVRGLLFPISRNAAIHAQRMQELAPELKKINEKYKDDMEGKLRAQREFQKRVGFNPLAGCLPALLQLPIFIGLYRTLSVDIELRQATFSSNMQWASNLAGPDMLYYWRDWLPEFFSGRGTGWLGPYFNILPLLVVALFLIQQKLFMPPPTDEQQVLTQKIMNIMTLMMGLFFFRVPAGLCIYFITSSLWGIAERVIVKKTIPPSKLAAAGVGGEVVEGTVTKRASGEKVSLADRIRNQMNPEPPKALPPAKRKRPPGKK